MKVPSSRKRLSIIVIVSLIFIGICTYLIQEGFWANIHSQDMIKLAKEHWDNGEYSSSIYWYRSAYSTVFEGGLRGKFLNFSIDQIDKLVRQGKISDARRVCNIAKMIWKQVVAISYKCQLIDQLSP